MRVPKDYKESLEKGCLTDELILSCLLSIDEALNAKNKSLYEHHQLILAKEQLLSLYQPAFLIRHLMGLTFQKRLTSLDADFSIDALIEKGLSGLIGQVNRMPGQALYMADVYKESVECTYSYGYIFGSSFYEVPTTEDIIKNSPLPLKTICKSHPTASLPHLPLHFVKKVVAKTYHPHILSHEENREPPKSISVTDYITKLKETHARRFLDHHLSLILLSMREEISIHSPTESLPLNEGLTSNLQVYARLLCDHKWQQLKAKFVLSPRISSSSMKKHTVCSVVSSPRLPLIRLSASPKKLRLMP